ncbi:zinc finger X-chromosomal protein-like [Epargyreus clarus]|uniref:zinc finger X-chromosomal protein-like n=1 Tax=Epargyreus clarus TaxID=520877 RepID=UPI003C2DF4C9
MDENDVFHIQNPEVNDPLQGVESADNPKHYRLNESVFAEPLSNIVDESIADEQAGDHFYFVDNVIVQKRAGRRLKYHINVDKDSTSSKCPQTNCTKSFATTTLLRAHIRKVHCADYKKFICENCGAGFSAKYLLERHMAVHSGERVECPICGKMLSRRTNMSEHLRCHSNTRQHICQLCGRAFVRRATLNTHVRFVHHTGDQLCDGCDGRFSSRKLLVNHKCQGKQKAMDLPPP